MGRAGRHRARTDEGRALPFALSFSLRSNLVRHRALTVFTALAVCVGVALATALEIAARGAEAELDATARSLAGAAAIEVTGGALGIDERLLADVSAVPGVAAAAPYLQKRFWIADEPGAALYVIGVDLRRDEVVRAYAVAGAEGAGASRAPLLAPRSVLVTRGFAKRLGIAVGGSVAIVHGRERVALTVSGLLASEGVAHAFGGNVAVMDVRALQELVGRTGQLDRIDVVPEAGTDVDALAARLDEQIAARATVRRSAVQHELVSYTLAMLRSIALALTLIGIGVAALLVFGATSLAVDRRSRDFAALRAVGFETTRARRLVQLDALVVAAAGTACGLPLGILLAGFFLRVISNVSAYLQDVMIERVAPTPTTFAVGLAVGLLVGWAGSVAPARRAAAASPLDALRDPASNPRPGWPDARWWSLRAVAVAAGAALALHGLGVPTLVRVALLFAIGIAILSSTIARLLPPALERWRPIELLFPRIGSLAGSSLSSRSRRASTTLAAVAGVIAGLTMTLIVVESLTTTCSEWIAGNYRGGVLVTAGTPVIGRDRAHVSHETARRIRGVPGVRAVSELFTGVILYGGEEVLLVGQTMSTLERFGRVAAIGIDAPALARRLAAGEIAVSDAFSEHFSVAPGDTVTLRTPKGPATFAVAGLFRDYSGPAGSVQIDIAVLDRYWDRDGSYHVAVWLDPPVEVAIERIRAATADLQDLAFVHGEELERLAGEVVLRLVTILTQISVLTVLLGGFAVVNLLIGSVTERQRELFLLRAVGASDGQLTALVLVDAVLVSVLGVTVGLAIGVLCSYPMATQLLREALGWTVHYRIPFAELALLAGAVVAASLLAGLYPARLARQRPPREVFAPE